MSDKITIHLPKALPAANDCLPHAAMTLGSLRGSHSRPGMNSSSVPLVSRLTIQESMGQWYLYRLDDGGGFVGDTSHPTREDAIASAVKEFGIDPATIT